MFRFEPEFLSLLQEKFRFRRRPTNTSGKPCSFSYKSLSDSLRLFVEDHLSSLNLELFKHYSSRSKYSGFGDDNLHRVFKNTDPGWNPSRELVDLLCYYAFDCSYKEAVSRRLISDGLSTYKALKSKIELGGTNLAKHATPVALLASDVVHRNHEIEREILSELSSTTRQLIRDLKQLIRDAAEAELGVYRSVPAIDMSRASEYYQEASSGYNMLYVYAEKYSRLGLVLNNPHNPSDKEIYDISLVQFSPDLAVFETVESWVLLWYDQRTKEYPKEEMYKVKNRQTYTIVNLPEGWRIRAVHFPEYDNT